MPIFYDLALLVAGVSGNAPLIAEGDELYEVVEPLAYRCGVIHGPFEFGFSQVFEQIGAANDLSELLKCIIQFILPSTAGQSPKYK